MTELSENLKLGAPFDLKTELLNYAYGINTNNPAFSWIVNDKRKNAVQEAYRIKIYSSLFDAEQDTQQCIDTDWQISTENSYVHVNGLEKVLKDNSNSLYYWSVQTKDQNGEQSALSVPCPFMTDIREKWISSKGIWSDSKNGLGNFVFFRSNIFNINRKKIAKVILSIAARDTESSLSQFCDLFVNGRSIGIGPARDFVNAPIDTSGKIGTVQYYNSYDITLCLQEKNNVIAVVANNRNKKTRAFLAQATAFYRDGTKEIITNSGGERNTLSCWKVLDGTIAFGDTGRTIHSEFDYFIMCAEDINVNAYPSLEKTNGSIITWRDADFDDKEWSRPEIGEEITHTNDDKSRVLCSYPSENTIRVVTNDSKKKVKKIGRSWFIDLGKEIIGGLKVSIDSPRAQKVRVKLGEQLNADGTVRYQLAAGPDYAATWTLKVGKNCFETVTMQNFRYIEIENFVGIIKSDDIMGWAMCQSFDESEACFKSDNDLLNRLYEFSKYTIKATNQDLYTDSQARERRPYEGDLLVNSNTSYILSNNYSLARHSNEYLIHNETWPADYWLFSIEMAWQDYLYTGNPDSLIRNYEVLKRKMTAGIYDESMGLVQINPGLDKRGNNGLIDWPVNERDNYVPGIYPTPLNAEFAGACFCMSQIATVVGNIDDKVVYEKHYNCIKKSMVHYLYNDKDGKFYDSMNSNTEINKHSSLHATAYALAYGIYDEKEYPDMLDKMTEFVCNNGIFKGSIYMTYFILRGLYKGNNGNAAAKLLLNQDNNNNKSFKAVLDGLNATIAPEAWNNDYKSNMTMSHPWGASSGCSLVQGMFGILPIKPGFKEFEIKIQPGDIRNVQMKVPTIKGAIFLSYINSSIGNDVKVKIPSNSRAKIFFLFKTEKLLHLHIVVDAESIIPIKQDGFLVVNVGAGKHKIIVQYL